MSIRSAGCLMKHLAHLSSFPYGDSLPVRSSCPTRKHHIHNLTRSNCHLVILSSSPRAAVLAGDGTGQPTPRIRRVVLL
jgi:hypothetical protein